MREKDSKGERGTREVLEIFRSASPSLTFRPPSLIPFYRIIRSTELFGEIWEIKTTIFSCTELFGITPNHSVFYRIIRYPTELFGPPNYSPPLPMETAKEMVGRKLNTVRMALEDGLFRIFSTRSSTQQQMTRGSRSS